MIEGHRFGATKSSISQRWHTVLFRLKLVPCFDVTKNTKYAGDFSPALPGWLNMCPAHLPPTLNTISLQGCSSRRKLENARD